jgi:hypothetical protein
VSLLPEPDVSALAGADPLSMLYFFASRSQESDQKETVAKIHGSEVERGKLLQQEQESIQKEVDALQHKSFWDSLGDIFGEVAKVAGVVASIAATVVTCGGAAPLAAVAIAGCILSTASFVDGEFHVLKNLGVDAKTAGFIDMGMSIAGAACSLGTSFAGGAQAASSALKVVQGTGAIVAGSTAVASGAFTVAGGEQQADADRAAADAVEANARSASLLRWMQQAIGDIQSANEQSRAYKQTIIHTKEIGNQTALTAATAIQG